MEIQNKVTARLELEFNFLYASLLWTTLWCNGYRLGMRNWRTEFEFQWSSLHSPFTYAPLEKV